ncbi:alpha-hydroxy-acid oxidizing protein [Vallicoccus soli]|uniref:Lactate 2-monooxygenase n=1 Tax=Vallicoccus soli TaxID=2339232 RepID=A0A3A3Z417_9ACTN|nr:alpha-hydroxy-acid oxidizing protein [Vallicoccus soli]RJK96366.1 lactate 2-monooxygenase [Vallicoccus soli]
MAESYGRRVQSRIYREGVLGRRPAVPVDPVRLAAAARRRMPRRAWAYVAGSAGQQATERANRAALDAWRIVPRMLRAVEERDLSVELFGQRYPAPVLLAPIGVLEMAHPEADLAVARASARLGLPMLVSTQGSAPVEATAAAAGATAPWFQLYWSREPDLVASMVRRAEASGCRALVVTVDTHLLGWRPQDLDLGHLPFARGLGIAQYTSDPVFARLVAERPRSRTSARPTPAAVGALLSMARHHPGGTWANLRSPAPRAAVETFLDVFSNPALTWDDLGRLRGLTSLPVLVKGVQTREDARLAEEHGADGVVVSNHGGRQVDGALGSLDALADVAGSVDVPVLFDSGIRGGADAFKALALGARAVLLGRPYVYGLALAGEEGVVQVVEHLVAELDLTLGLAGCRTLADVGPAAVRRC